VMLPCIEVDGDGEYLMQCSQAQRSEEPSRGGIRPDSRQNSHRAPGGSMSSPGTKRGRESNGDGSQTGTVASFSALSILAAYPVSDPS